MDARRAILKTPILKNPATRNRIRDHLIAAALYSQMLYQLSYSRLVQTASKAPPAASALTLEEILKVQWKSKPSSKHFFKAPRAP